VVDLALVVLHHLDRFGNKRRGNIGGDFWIHQRILA
jgi:hypothetical protein